MAAQGFLLIATFLLVLMVLARPLGSGLARLINDIPLPGTTGVERVLFRALGVSDREMNWKQYLCAILGLNMLGLAVLFFMLLGQHYLPLNPQQLPGLSWDLALNTAVSFVTNTNWQSYSGETTLSYFSQMAGLTVQNFLSAASGIAVIFCPHPCVYPPEHEHTRECLGRSATHHVMGARPCGVVDRTVFYSTRCAAKLSALSGCEYR